MIERLETEREIARFLAKIVVDCASDCWVWTGSRTRGDRGEYRGGYGRFKLRGKPVMAHRAAFVTWRGPIPQELELDHVTCDTRACANPWHMEPATARANTLRSNAASALHARKAVCPSCGGPYSPRGLRRKRYCRRCHNAWARSRYIPVSSRRRPTPRYN